jgi:hypothetical protein
MFCYCVVHLQVTDTPSSEGIVAWRIISKQTETVALCFGYPKTPCLRADGKLSSRADEQAKSFEAKSAPVLSPKVL